MKHIAATLITGLAIAAPTYAITLTTATVTENFDAYSAAAAAPPVADWSTTSLTAATTTGSFASAAATITNNTTFDTQLGLLAATDMVTALNSAVAVGTNTKGKIITASNVGPFTSPHLATQVTGLSWTGVMGNLVVGGTSNLTGMSVVWDSGIDAVSGTGATADDSVFNGHRLYYSVGGAVGSFKPVANYLFASGSAVNSTILNNTANIVFDSAVAPGTNIYVVWADDNAVTNADGAYAIDNVRFTGIAVPEPGVVSTLMACMGLFAVRRRR